MQLAHPGLTSAMNCLAALAIVLLCASANAQTDAALEMFSVAGQGDGIRVTLTFNATTNITSSTPCFLNKLVFYDTDNQFDLNRRSFRPTYPGSCQVTAEPSNQIVANMDPRDFVDAVGVGIFVSMSNTNLETIAGLERGFLPSIDLQPIREPLPVAAFSVNTDTPSLSAFDVDLVSGHVYLHFTDIMDMSSFRSVSLTLHNTVKGMSHELTRDSRPIGVEASLVMTICVTLDDADLAELIRSSICVNGFSSCSCSFDSQMVSSYNAIPVQDVPPERSLQVSKLRKNVATSMTTMSLTVSYLLGCGEITFMLAVDEVYVVRPGESINRIGCFGRTITFGPDDVTDGLVAWEDGRGTYFNFDGGFQSENFGLYSCVSELGREQHYITNVSPFIGLPEGLWYSARLSDPITIPLLFGSEPQLNITDPNIEILLVPASIRVGVSPPEAAYRRLSPYRAEAYYAEARFSLAQVFTLRVIAGDLTAEIENINIGVSPPAVNITPSAVALLPGDTSAVLRCAASGRGLDVFWYTISPTGPQIISSVAELMVAVPPQGLLDETAYSCGVRDPENPAIEIDNSVATTRAVVTNIPDPLSVSRDGEQIEDQQSIEIVNRLSGNLTLRCLGHAPSNVRDLMWVLEPEGEPPVVLRPEWNDNYTMVSYGYNEANLTINNFVRPYRGTLRCQSVPSSMQITISVTDGSTDGFEGPTCPAGDTDPRYGIEWRKTAEGGRDSQSCAETVGMETTGFAFRRCGSGGEWEESVDVINCRSVVFESLRTDAEETFLDFDGLSESDRRSVLRDITRDLINSTTPRGRGLFPLDLDTSVFILGEILTRQAQISVTTSTELEEDGIDVLDNLLDENNVLSWKDLNEISRASRDLLVVIEAFSIAVVRGSPDVKLSRGNIYISGRRFTPGMELSDVMFPNNSLPISDRGQVTVPMEVLDSQEPVVVGAAIENLQNILPQPPKDPNSNKVTRGASIVLSVSVGGATPDNFSADIEFSFTTDRLLRASNPRCAFWNEANATWDETGIETLESSKGEIGEYKTFNIRAAANHLTAFAVLVDQDDTQDFELTIPFYIGCGFVIFFAFVSMFAIYFSCIFDKLRKYSFAAYFIHLNVCMSILSAYLAFLAGLNTALDNTAGCIGTSALIHYFFTASFTWLLCEVLAITFFSYVSRRPWTFILFFILGWGIPVIPTAISLGVIRDQYSATTHCWFFFDGEFAVPIVLAFIIPKLLIFAVTLGILLLACCAICCLVSNAVEGQSKLHIRLLSFEWLGVLLLLLLLSGSWVFALLHVNAYALDAAITGWIFMGISIALGVWIFLFNAVVSIINHKVDYELLWEAVDGLKTLERKKAKPLSGYSLSASLPMSPMSGPGDEKVDEVDEVTRYNAVYDNEIDDPDQEF